MQKNSLGEQNTSLEVNFYKKKERRDLFLNYVTPKEHKNVQFFLNLHNLTINSMRMVKTCKTIYIKCLNALFYLILVKYLLLKK